MGEEGEGGAVEDVVSGVAPGEGHHEDVAPAEEGVEAGAVAAGEPRRGEATCSRFGVQRVA